MIWLKCSKGFQDNHSLKRGLFGVSFAMKGNGMINYTTPTITLTVEGVDITQHNVYVSLEQGVRELTKTGSDLILQSQQTDTVITFTLTQEESASFDFRKNVSIQVNWITSGGVRAATEIKSIDVMRNLLDEVIQYD